MRCRTFPEPVGPRILLLESVDYFRTSKHFNGRKKLINKTLMVRLTGLGVVNIHCMEMSLLVSMRFIFGCLAMM